LFIAKKIDAMVPLVRTSLQIPPRMQGFWNDNDNETPKIVVESSRGVDGEPSPSVEGFP
jgi:hypothetical protein